MRRCAFLSTDDLEGYVIYDELAYPYFAALGWAVEAVPWRARVDWSDYEMVILRTPWDYQKEPERFLAVLEEIDSQTLLVNSLDIVRWNLRKDYLRDLEERGIAIVPTLFKEAGEPFEDGIFAALGSEKLVVKPLVSGSAEHTYVLDVSSWRAQLPELESVFSTRPSLVQPFIPAVTAEGEYSLFFFSGELSHTVLKTPKVGDFRVQEEHGGLIQAVEPEPAMCQAAEKIVAAIDETLLYARVDLVRGPDHPDDFLLMELELIEPSLYFPFAEGSPERFAKAAVALLD